MKAVEEAGRLLVVGWQLSTSMGTDLSSASRVLDASFCRFFNSIVRMKLFMMVFEVVIFWVCLLFMYAKRSNKQTHGHLIWPLIRICIASSHVWHSYWTGIAAGRWSRIPCSSVMAFSRLSHCVAGYGLKRKWHVPAASYPRWRGNVGWNGWGRSEFERKGDWKIWSLGDRNAMKCWSSKKIDFLWVLVVI